MTERLVDRLRNRVAVNLHGQGTAFADPLSTEAANVIEELGEVLRAARGIIFEDAEACRAFRHESEGPSGPENVLAKIDAALSHLRGYGK